MYTVNTGHSTSIYHRSFYILQYMYGIILANETYLLFKYLTVIVLYHIVMFLLNSKIIIIIFLLKWNR